MNTSGFRASCPCGACARLAGIATVQLAEDERAEIGRRLVASVSDTPAERCPEPASYAPASSIGQLTILALVGGVR